MKTWEYEIKGPIRYKIKPTLSYTNQKFGEKSHQKFESKLELIKHLDGIGHPAIQLEQMLQNFTKISQNKSEENHEIKEKVELKEEKEENVSNKNVDTGSDNEEDIDKDDLLLS